MKITAIKQQVKNPERVNVFVDGKYEFSLTLDELLKEKLKNNDVLEKLEVKRLKKISADGKLRLRSMEWLLNRPRSEREFNDYLFRKKAEPEQTAALIADFTAKGYLDNRKFGQWFTDLLMRRGKSSRAIRSELFKKGLSRELVDELLSTNQNDETARLKQVIDKKLKLSRFKNDQLKLAKYLTSQGFSYPLVKEQLRLLNSDNE